MFQPLDYMFLILISVYTLYLGYLYWDRYVRVKQTSDDLIEKYIELQRRKNG